MDTFLNANYTLETKIWESGIREKVITKKIKDLLKSLFFELFTFKKVSIHHDVVGKLVTSEVSSLSILIGI